MIDGPILARFFRLLAGTLLLALASCSMPSAAQATSASKATERVTDIDWLIDTISRRYPYLDENETDLSAMRALYRQEAIAASTENAWLHVLEDLLDNLYDHHVNVNRHVDSSRNLVPSGTNVWAEVADGRAIVTEVLPNSPAAEASIRAGDEITAIGDVPVVTAIRAALPPAASIAVAGDYVLRGLLAGDHERIRVITLVDGRRIALPPFEQLESEDRVTWRWLPDKTGYIRIENSLGSDDTVADFDAAVAHLRGARGLILDLRFTPSGGNTGVARPIIGRFIETEGAFQRYEGTQFEGGVMLDRVHPRGPFTLTMPAVVLVGRWTGSMGEGIAIGLDALGRATVVGTPMAGLRGGTERFVLPNTGVAISLPVFRILHVNGSPREGFVPPISIDLRSATGPDSVLVAGLDELRRLRSTMSPR